MSDDRTIHAADARGGIEVVRYDRAGKWFIEIKEGYGRPGLPAERVPCTVKEAAEATRSILARGGSVFLGRHGGRSFDRLLGG